MIAVTAAFAVSTNVTRLIAAADQKGSVTAQTQETTTSQTQETTTSQTQETDEKESQPAGANTEYYTIYDVSLRKSPSSAASRITTVKWGTAVTITGEDGDWYKVSVNGSSGYIYKEYIAAFDRTADEAFAEMIEAFPESYKTALWIIHSVYPNYVFECDSVGLDFDEVVDKEIYKKVEMSDPDSWKAMYKVNYSWSTGEWVSSEGGYTIASREVVAYFVDPRSWLTVDEIYMFMRQTSTGEETIENVRSMLEGTFMEKGYTPNPDDKDDVACGGDYAKVIMKAAEEYGLSPYYLVSNILVEQSYDGSDLSSGTYPGYEGYYNFFNYGATGNDVIKNGLQYAKEKGWNSVYKSIVNGAKSYATGYVAGNQDTYYYMDYNVLNPDSLWHQYATCVYDQMNKGIIMGRACADQKNAAIVFRIPVYENMPETRTTRPAENDSVNNYYFLDLNARGLTQDNSDRIEGFSMYVNAYTLSISEDTSINYTLPEGASYISDDSFSVSKGTTEITLTVEAQTGYTRDYVITVNAAKACTITMAAYTLGDIDENGTIDIIDLARMQKHILGKETLSGDAFAAADMDKNGTIDSEDIELLKEYIQKDVKTSLSD